MCLLLRNTHSRGRDSVPLRFFRMRSWIRSRTSLESIFGILLTSRLAGLLFQALAGIADSFVLVGIRFFQGSDIRGNLSDQLTIDAADDEFRLLIDSNVDTCRNRILDWVRKSQRED